MDNTQRLARVVVVAVVLDPFPGMPSDEVQTTYGGNGAPGIVIVAYPT